MHHNVEQPISSGRKRMRSIAACLLAAAFAAAAFMGCTTKANSPTVSTASSPAATSAPAATPSPTPEISMGAEVSLGVYPAVWCPAVSSQGSIRLTAKGSDGKPLTGDWSATQGAFLLPPVKNDDGTISTPDQQPVSELKGLSEVGWLLPEEERAKGGSIEVSFTHDGQSTVLIFNWDSDMGLMTVGELLVDFSADETRIIKEFSAMVTGGKTNGELLAYTKENITKLKNCLCPVLADGIVNKLINGRQTYTDILDSVAEDNYDALSQLEGKSDFDAVKGTIDSALADAIQPVYDNGYGINFQDGNIYADINWSRVTQALNGQGGDDVTEYIRLAQLEDEKPFVVEGLLEVTADELAQRYADARSYVAKYPLRGGWYGDIEMYRDSYLSSLLILNGQLFPMVGDEFIVPDNLKTAYDGIISKYADDELGKLLADYKALLIKNGWKLTDEVRDFLTDNGVPGYGRLDSNS